MMRSLYSGVSGLKNHQIRMDVVSNNVSNVNTIGFKRGRVTFQDMISQNMSGASKPREGRGGVNPKQIGLGMQVAAIDTIHTQGAIQVTGKITDVALMGKGFFIQKQGERTFYTRAGNFGIDRDKYLVNPANGFKVQGWNSTTLPDGSTYINTSSPTGDIIIPVGDKYSAKATSQVKYKCNLNASARIPINPDNPTREEIASGATHTASINVYDSRGRTHKVNITFVRQDENTWMAKVNVPGSVPNTTQVDVGPRSATATNQLVFKFNNSGSPESLRDVVAQGQRADSITRREGQENQPQIKAKLRFNVPDDRKQATGQNQGEQLEIDLDFGTIGKLNGVTQYNGKTTTKAVDQDGYGMGYLESFQINDSGIVIGSYSNGQRRELAQIAVATFVNAEGLERAGDTTFIETVNSGAAQVGEAQAQGRGRIVAGSLEMSNVDLSEEFVDMIVTQRGFQANSRSITTSDQMLQEILTLKR